MEELPATKPGIRLLFVGKPNSGQTTAAVYLKNKKKFKRIRMMQGVTRICKTLYNYRLYQRPSWDKKRAIYDALYKIDPDIWITYVKYRLEKTTEPIVIDDAKFLNEVKALKEIGFIVIRINSAAKHRVRSIGRFLGSEVIPGTIAVTEFFNKDPTEVMNVDYSIYHDGNNDHLRATIDELLTKFDQEDKASV